MARPTAADGRSYGLVHALREGRRSDDAATIEVHHLGELAGAGDPRHFRRSVSACPYLGAGIRRAARAEAALVHAEPEAPHVRVGSLRQDPALPAHLVTDALLGRHFAILGGTGSGKSCAVTVLLEAVLDAHPFAHVLLIDPHDGYAAAFGERALRLDSSSLELPYWLLTFEEIAAILTSGSSERAYAEGAIPREAILRARRLHAGDRDGTAGHFTVGTPVPYRLSDLARDRGRHGRPQQARGNGRVPAPPGPGSRACARTPVTPLCSSPSTCATTSTGPWTAPAHPGGRAADSLPRHLRRAVRGGERRRLGLVPAAVRVQPLVPVHDHETPICTYAAMGIRASCSARTWAGVR